MKFLKSTREKWLASVLAMTLIGAGPQVIGLSDPTGGVATQMATSAAREATCHSIWRDTPLYTVREAGDFSCAATLSIRRARICPEAAATGSEIPKECGVDSTTTTTTMVPELDPAISDPS